MLFGAWICFDDNTKWNMTLHCMRGWHGSEGNDDLRNFAITYAKFRLPEITRCIRSWLFNQFRIATKQAISHYCVFSSVLDWITRQKIFFSFSKPNDRAINYYYLCVWRINQSSRLPYWFIETINAHTFYCCITSSVLGIRRRTEEAT